MARVTSSSFHYTQALPAAEWVIVHNLSGGGNLNLPVIDVIVEIDGIKQKVVPKSITLVDKNTLTVKFSEARSGFATIIN